MHTPIIEHTQAIKKIINRLKNIFNDHSKDILNGDYSHFIEHDFCSFSVHQEDSKTVLSLRYKDENRTDIPDSYRHVDIFFLPKGLRLGAHYHEDATAKIIVLAGQGTARIGDKEISFEKDDAFTFPATVIHDVKANNHGDVAFISFQNSPIARPDGSFDYHAV